MAQLDADRIASLLDRPEAWNVHVADEVSSTNDDVLAVPPTGVDALGAVLFAERQSAGRGRRGNPWFSGPPESNLIFSCRVQPRWPMPTWGRLTHLTALALKRALDDYPPARPLVKWPNDLYLGRAKVAGILTETKLRSGHEAIGVIGVGMNVNVLKEELPEEIRDLATSLREVTGMGVDREGLAATILDALTEVLSSSPDDFTSYLDELRGAHYLLGQTIRARLGESSIEGKAIDLGPEGELVIETSVGKREILTSADEVRLTH